MKKTVLKVNMNCIKCKTNVMKTVTKLSGINDVAVDLKEVIVTVTGDVGPVLVTRQIRKIGRVVEIVSVGPPKPDPPKPDTDPKPFPLCCGRCQLVSISYLPYEYEWPQRCIIL